MRQMSSAIRGVFVATALCCAGPAVGEQAGPGPATQGTTTLGDGLVTTRTDVENRADIALDVRDMADNLLQGDYNQASIIYQKGRNSLRYDKRGEELPDKRSLRSLSTSAATVMAGDMTWSTHMWGLTEGKLATEEESFQLYADTFVMGALERKKGTLAAEAAVALNLWMYAAHELWEALLDCSSLAEGVNTAVIGLSADNGGGAHSIDEFIAYWVGSDQLASTTDGHSLYALAQRAGGLFGTNDREAKVNSQIVALYEEARAALAFSGACGTSSNTVEQLWKITNQILSRMTIPLVQLLIDAMEREDTDRIELYALAVVPQTAACRPSVYRRLQERLLSQSYDSTKYEAILFDLQMVYDCLGITCEDIGAYKVNVVGECAGIPIEYPLAEYTPSTPVHAHSKIDLDILSMRMMLDFENSARANTMAGFIYEWGKHSSIGTSDADPNAPSYDTRSLRDLATSSLRRKLGDSIPYYLDFEEYHDDPNYAHTVVQETLDSRGDWGTTFPTLRREIIVRTIQSQVMYMYVMTEMADAVADCEAGDPKLNEAGAHSWDEVAAFIIGSLESYGSGGSNYFDDGTLLWHLANSVATQFGTLNSDGYAKINAEVEDLLYAGRGELDALDCSNLRGTVAALSNLLLVPLMQSVLMYARRIEGKMTVDDSVDVAAGHVMALSVAPVVKKFSAPAAQVLERNMIVGSTPGGKGFVSDGPQAVAEALATVVDDLGLDCRYLGKTGSIDPCRNYDGPYVNSANDKTSTGGDGGMNRGAKIFVIMLVATFIMGCSCFTAYFFLKP